MTDILDNGPKYPKAFYTKRYDLRPEEFSPEVEFDQYDKWAWWISSSDLSRRRGDVIVECFDNGLSDEEMEILLNDECALYYLPVEEENEGVGPAELISLFCLCHRRGVYPPPWLMNNLYKKFNQYLREKLDGSDKLLDEIFAGNGKGLSRTYFKQAANGPIWDTAMHDLNRFRIWFGLTIKDATAIVAQYKKLGMKEDQGFSTVEKKYKEFNKIDPFERHKDFYKKHPPSRRLKVRVVKRYPKDTFIPHWPIFREYWED